MDTLIADLRQGLRLWRRAPVFTAVIIGTLMLGIGANAAVFSTLYEVVLRALPYRDPDRVVMLWEDASYVSFPRNTPAPGNYFDWKRLNRSFTDVAATRGLAANLTAGGPPEQVLGRGVTSNFFAVLGVQPQLGRTFTAEEEASGASVVLISHRLWQRRYAADPGVVGSDVLMNGSKQTVIGVMPPSFAFRNREMDYWGPLRFNPGEAATRNSHFLNVVARLQPNVTIERAREDMNAVARQLATEYPDSNARVGAVVVPMAEDALGNTRLELLILMAAAGAVLLIACANLASLMLSRAAARRGELAVRIACGATRGRLIRQMVMEALPLALTGGALGLIAAPAGRTLLEHLVPTSLPEVQSSVVNVPIVAFTALLSVATGVLFSIVPAVQAGRRSIQDSLQNNGRGAVGGTSRLTRDGLVVVQVALAFLLLVSASLMLRTLSNLRAIDLGFHSEQLLTLRTSLPREKYANATARATFFDRVIDGVKHLSGVQNAGYVSTPPFLSQGNTRSYGVDGKPPVPGSESDALYRVATNDYLATLGVQLVEGRLFEAGDTADRPLSIIVNETLARRHWPGVSALGHQIRFGLGTVEPWFTVVGVVKDVRERGHILEMKPGVYLPYAQASANNWPEVLVVRTTGDPLALTPAIRSIIAVADREQPIAAVRTMEAIVDLDVADRQQQLTLLGAFAALALALSALGLYGVLSYNVTQRRREIGLRMALGASRASVVRLVVTRGLMLTLVGLAVGFVLATVLTRTIAALLYGVGVNDIGTLAGVIALLVVVALTACSLPALRAVRIDPMRVLRQEN